MQRSIATDIPTTPGLQTQGSGQLLGTVGVQPCVSGKMLLKDNKTEEKTKQNMKLGITRGKESNILV